MISLSMQYGEVDIDGSLVAAQQRGEEDIVMLNNGCMCCTVRGDLVRMLEELIRKRRDNFDHIMIETTGEYATLLEQLVDCYHFQLLVCQQLPISFFLKLKPKSFLSCLSYRTCQSSTYHPDFLHGGVSCTSFATRRCGDSGGCHACHPTH